MLMRTPAGLEAEVTSPTDAHRAFALSSMFRQLIDVRPFVPGMDRHRIDRLMAHLEGRWGDPAVTRLVALDPTDPWLVLGFVLGLPADPHTPVLSYLHVRGGVRGLGLATLLADLLGIRPGVPTLVEVPTWDLIRERPGRDLPTGLLRNPRWALTVVDPLGDPR